MAFSGHALGIAGLTALTLAALLAGRGKLAGTTLIAPWAWTVLAVSLIGGWGMFGVTAAPTARPATWVPPVQYIIASSTFCPIIAVLGARRPQHRGWQWIVLSLWGIISVPAVMSLLSPSATFSIHAVWSWFLAVLLVVGLLNYLPTRFAAAAAAWAAGQATLMAHQLPGLSRYLAGRGSAADAAAGFTTAGPSLALGFFAAAVLLALILAHLPNRRDTNGFDRLWTDYRNSFGAVWAVRLADRINDHARRSGWPVALRWNGFRPTAEDSRHDRRPGLAPAEHQALQQDMLNYLRRFVSDPWIQHRLAIGTAQPVGVSQD